MEDLEEFKNILKAGGIEIEDDELEETLTKAKYLINQWLDSFERDIFEGKTLQELLASNIL